jgi:hypothetical protein
MSKPDFSAMAEAIWKESGRLGHGGNLAITIRQDVLIKHLHRIYRMGQLSRLPSQEQVEGAYFNGECGSCAQSVYRYIRDNMEPIHWPSKEDFRAAYKEFTGGHELPDGPGVRSASMWAYEWLRTRVTGEGEK